VDVAGGPARCGSTRSAAAALGRCEEGERGEGDADQVGRLGGLSQMANGPVKKRK
jgi:hypothetical protein